MEEELSLYERNVLNRSWFHYMLGLIVRWKQNLKYICARRIARKRGALIGEGVIMPISLARKVNFNVKIGNHVSIHTDNFSSFRYPISIGNNVIIGSNVRFVMGSHNIDSQEWGEHYRPNKGLLIEDYVWLCPDSVILPACELIGYGAVVGANAVVVKDVPPMAVMGGNPAVELRMRKQVHTNLVVESLLGGDFKRYVQARKLKNGL